MSEEKPIISQHLFFFPFVIKSTDQSCEFCRKDTLTVLQQDGWKWEQFNPEKNFSEFVYFHKYVREAAFNGKEYKNSFADFYTKPISSLKDSLLLYWGNEEHQYYKLPVEFVSLHIFETGIGILTVELLNHDYPNSDDVLKISDLARRLYPPFLGEDGTANAPKQNGMLPNKVHIRLGDIEIVEDYSGPYFEKNELMLGRHIQHILGSGFLCKYKVEPVIDDRMYTICWYGNDELSGALNFRHRRQYAYENSDDWYRFVFVDGGDSCCKNIDMRRDLISGSTYARWAEYGTLFGISRYSFVALTDRSDFSYDVVREHMQRQYYQMAIFLLAQRASAISFASRISRISREIDQPDDEIRIEKIAKDVRKLHGDFIGFVNRLWFEEVTPQEQGIELFEIAQRQMKLKEQIAELKEEMKELFEYVELQYEKKQTENDRELNKVIGLLTKVSVIFLPLSLLTGAWGMNIIEMDGVAHLPSILIFILSCVLTINIINKIITWIDPQWDWDCFVKKLFATSKKEDS